MKAITYKNYGSPDVLKLSDVEKPSPKADEVLIRIHAASVNPLDWHIMRGKPWIARLSSGVNKPRIPFLGADVAGTVEAVGEKVTSTKPGDEVFGAPLNINLLGSLAEYVCLPEEGLVPKSSNISFEEAAAVPVAAITALQSIKFGRLGPGQKVLINGASGGVGTFSVQLAKLNGAEVTGVCSTRNVELVRSLGADQVIDYTKEDFTHSGQKYDLLIDNVGNYKVSAYRRVLNPKGRCVIVGYTSAGLLMHHMLVGPLSSMVNKQKVGMMKTAQMNKPDLITLKDLLEAGKIKSVIDKQYSLAEAPEAVRYLETGHARAKVVIRVGHQTEA